MILIIKAFAGRALAVLGRLNVWQLLLIVMTAFAALQSVRLASEQRHARKVEAQLAKAADALNRITTARNEQRRTSETTVTRVIQGQDRVRTIVKTIHDAPNPPDCKTPALDQARNAL